MTKGHRFNDDLIVINGDCSVMINCEAKGLLLNIDQGLRSKGGDCSMMIKLMINSHCSEMIKKVGFTMMINGLAGFHCPPAAYRQ